jgi:homoserine kinase
VTPLEPGSAVRVRVPASSANIGPGFDSIGLALGIWDEYTVEITGPHSPPELLIQVQGEGADAVPRDENHLVYRSMVRAWAELGVESPAGIIMGCVNAVPHGRGLGSSATAIVAGIVAAQGLQAIAAGERELDSRLDRHFTNDLASAIEGHPDNASASVYGGMTLSWSNADAPRRTHTVRLEVCSRVVPVVFVPAAQLATSTARAVLPERVPHADAALNSARAALLVEAVTRQPDLLLPATREWLHQEQRRDAFPASMALVDTLRAAGHAAVISGAGPSVLVLTTPEQADRAARLAPDPAWRVLTPGMPTTGARVDLLKG